VLTRLFSSIVRGSALLALVSCALQSAVRAGDGANVESRRAADSEQALLERRAERLKQFPPPPAPPTVEQPTANAIDQFIVAAWQAARLDAAKEPPPVCDDATFVRRTYLDVIGVIPTVVEINRFLADRSPQKRAKLVDQLLARRAEYAVHWTPFWEDALASQPVLGQGGIPTRGNYREWLLASFEHNRPFDVMVAELIDPTMPGRRREVDEELIGTHYAIGYVRNEDHTVTLQTAANVGQRFKKSVATALARSSPSPVSTSPARPAAAASPRRPSRRCCRPVRWARSGAWSACTTAAASGAGAPAAARTSLP